jgi:molybdate transport system substrate-binding protein
MKTRTSARRLAWAAVCAALLWLGESASCEVVQAQELTVSAAASLTNAFREIGKAFEQASAGSKVLFNFGASGQLLQQIARGAPVDVFASADEETMDRAQQQSLIVNDSRATFATNKLVLIVPADSTLRLSELGDLAGAKVQRIAVGNPDSVPVGHYAKEALTAAGLWDKVSAKIVYTQNVRQSLDYVSRGEVDAGFVYLTDIAVAGGKVHSAMQVPLDKAILYPIAAVKGSKEEQRAREFIAFVRSEKGRGILSKYGFSSP